MTRWDKLPVVQAAAALVGLFLTLQPCQSAPLTYTVGDMSGWQYGLGITGFGVFSNNGFRIDESNGQTFIINNVDALVDSITFPLYGYTSGGQFQVGVAAWDGTHPTGSFLYLSDPLVTEEGWQTFIVSPSDLILNRGQTYLLFFTPNAFLNSDPTFMTMLGWVPTGYADGQYYMVFGQMSVNDLLHTGWIDAHADMAFSISYHEVPEPSAIVFVSLGLLVMAGASMKRRTLRVFRIFKKSVHLRCNNIA